MKDLTIYIPLHKYENGDNIRLTRAVDSAIATKVKNIVILAPEALLEKIKSDFTQRQYQKLVFEKSSEHYDLSSQINYAANELCKTDYFSVLEYDDEFTPNWFNNVETYTKHMKDVSFFLPLAEVYDKRVNTESPIKYLNEAYWASSFSENIGCLDTESIINYMNVNVFGMICSGGVYKTKDFIAVGGLKPSFKLTFWHEFLLRALHNEKKGYVIPKVGYIHHTGLKDSMSEVYLETMSDKEIEFWIDLAQKEYFFKNDRNKTYEE